MTFLKRTLGILFAGMLLFITTACSNPTTSASTKDVPQRSTSNVEQTITDQVNRADRSAAGIKRDVETLKQQTQDKMIDMTGDVGENTRRTLDRKAENAERAGSQIKNNAREAKNRVENQADASINSAKAKADRALDNAADKVDDLS